MPDMSFNRCTSSNEQRPSENGLRHVRKLSTGKQMILGAQVLCHYDANKPLKLACDVSAYGVGAVLSHLLENGD